MSKQPEEQWAEFAAAAAAAAAHAGISGMDTSADVAAPSATTDASLYAATTTAAAAAAAVATATRAANAVSAAAVAQTSTASTKEENRSSTSDPAAVASSIHQERSKVRKAKDVSQLSGRQKRQRTSKMLERFFENGQAKQEKIRSLRGPTILIQHAFLLPNAADGDSTSDGSANNSGTSMYEVYGIPEDLPRAVRAELDKLKDDFKVSVERIIATAHNAELVEAKHNKKASEENEYKSPMSASGATSKDIAGHDSATSDDISQHQGPHHDGNQNDAENAGPVQMQEDVNDAAQNGAGEGNRLLALARSADGDNTDNDTRADGAHASTHRNHQREENVNNSNSSDSKSDASTATSSHSSSFSSGLSGGNSSSTSASAAAKTKNQNDLDLDIYNCSTDGLSKVRLKSLHSALFGAYFKHCFPQGGRKSFSRFVAPHAPPPPHNRAGSNLKKDQMQANIVFFRQRLQ